jgi:hypothetical protein
MMTQCVNAAAMAYEREASKSMRAAVDANIAAGANLPEPLQSRPRNRFVLVGTGSVLQRSNVTVPLSESINLCAYCRNAYQLP